MKRLILAVGAGLMAAAMASPSPAADVPRPVYKAPPARFADLGTSTCDAATRGIATDVDPKINIVRAGVNYQF